MLSFITPRISKLYLHSINQLSLLTALCLAMLLSQASNLFGQQCPLAVSSRPVPEGCGGHGGGGGGTGGGTPPAGTLSWSGPVDQPGEGVSGAPQRFGVGAAIFAPSTTNTGSLYVAWTSTQVINGNGDANVILGNSTAGGADYQNQSTIVDVNGNTLAGGGNPALAVLNGRLYVGDEDVEGFPVYTSTADGTTWTPAATCGGGYTGSVTLAAFQGSMYMALENAADQSLTLCVIADQSNQANVTAAPTIRNFPGVDTAFVAGLGTFIPPGGVPTLYIAYETSGNSHDIYYYTTTDGVNFNFSTAAAGDQSSTTPSLVSHKGILQMGFRSNDGSHYFLTKYSTDGVNWSTSSNTGVTMGGPPVLVDSAASPLPGSAENGDIFNIFVSNDSNQFINTMFAQ